MDKSAFKCLNRLCVFILCIIGLAELGLALWTIFDDRYKVLAYSLADVGYIDLWILRYLSLCLFVSSIITLVMCLILIWGLYSAHVLLFIASTMLLLIVTGELTVAIYTFKSKYETRITLMEQLPKLVITYRQGNDERARRALDILQYTFHCCGADGRISFKNNVPSSCNMFSVGCTTRTMFFLDSCMDALGAVLLFFSLIKLLIVIYFYSFLCLNYRSQREYLKKNPHDLSLQRRLSSLDLSSSSDNLPKKTFISPIRTYYDVNENSDHEDKQHVLFNEYNSSSPLNKQYYTTTIISPLLQNNQNSELTTRYEQHGSRKLSCISERTEKDESENDLSRLKFSKSKGKATITDVYEKYHPPILPKKAPIIKKRQSAVRYDENDSGVEHSPSEKSFDDQRQSSRTKSTSSLSFSKVFVTSLGQNVDNEVRKPLTTSSPSSSSSPSSDRLFPNEIIILPKPILKKTNHNQNQIPLKPIPRSTLRNRNQDESLV